MAVDIFDDGHRKTVFTPYAYLCTYCVYLLDGQRFEVTGTANSDSLVTELALQECVLDDLIVSDPDRFAGMTTADFIITRFHYSVLEPMAVRVVSLTKTEGISRSSASESSGEN